MKNWNAPVVEELNVNMTANGFFDADVETWIFWNESNKKPKEEEKTPTES